MWESIAEISTTRYDIDYFQDILSDAAILVVASRRSLHGELHPLTDPHSAQTLLELLTLVNSLIAARATVLEVHSAGSRYGIVRL